MPLRSRGREPRRIVATAVVAGNGAPAAHGHNPLSASGVYTSAWIARRCHCHYRAANATRTVGTTDAAAAQYHQVGVTSLSPPLLIVLRLVDLCLLRLH
jgi:hypothetical protein